MSESLTWKEENCREYVRPTAGEPPRMSLGDIHRCSPAREKLRPTADEPRCNSRRGCSATAALYIACGCWQASLLVACRSAAIAIDRFDRRRANYFDNREVSIISGELWWGLSTRAYLCVLSSWRPSSYQRRPTPTPLIVHPTVEIPLPVSFTIFFSATPVSFTF
jgi:hypothetical protein